MADNFGAQLREATRNFRAMSGEVRRGIRPAIKKGAEPMVAQARANASWSRRIPKAIKLSVAKRGVDLRVSGKRAPHARPYEGIIGGSTFRHPVFGDRGQWVSQRTRPFLTPAVEKHRGKVRRELIELLDDTARKHGYQ